MGIRLFSRSSSSYEPAVINKRNKRSLQMSLANPNPNEYKIVWHHEVGNHLVVEINYPDCTNYEGNKVLVYKNTTMSELEAQGSIDPHFCDNRSFLSPFARFEPTGTGKAAAIAMCKYVI